MKIEDVIIRVKRQFGDESGVQVTSEDIIRWINEAQNDIAQTQKILESRAQLELTTGISTYFLPPRIIELKHVFCGDRKLKYFSINEFHETVDNFLGTENPICYTSWGEVIDLKPTPKDESESLIIYYSCFPEPIISTLGELTIPERYHNRILEYCIQQAYELDENFEAATYKGTQFTSSMVALAGDEQWDGKETYPSITVLWEDL